MFTFEKSFRPFSPLFKQSHAGILLARFPETEVCKDGELLQSAKNWLSSHPQEDENIRLRTSELLRFIGEATEVEVAAALLADLPKDSVLIGVHPAVAKLAKRYSEFFSLESIEQEKSDRSALLYRIFRIMAEFDCSLDLFYYKDLLDYPLDGDRRCNRWDSIIQLLKTKSYPVCKYAEILEGRLYWAKYQLSVRTEDESAFYQVTGSEEGINYFKNFICPYFRFLIIQDEPNKLVFGQDYLMQPCMTRLIDGLSSYFESDLEFQLHSFGRRPRDNSYFDAIELDRMEAIVAVLGNVEILNPVKQLLKGVGFKNTFSEKERLLSIAFPKQTEDSKASSLNTSTEKSRKHECWKLSPENCLDLDEYFHQKPESSILFIGFNILTDKDGMPFCDIGDIPGRKEIYSWVSSHFPELRLLPLTNRGKYCSEPYQGGVSIQGKEEDIQRFKKLFSKTWEDSSGKSLDPHFALYEVIDDGDDEDDDEVEEKEDEI